MARFPVDRFAMGFIIVFLVIAAIFVGAAQAADGTNDPACAALLDCYNCTSTVRCGWCPGNDEGSRCISGTALKAAGVCTGGNYHWGTCRVSNKNAGIIVGAAVGTVVPACLIAYCLGKRFKRRMREQKNQDRSAFVRMADHISSKYGDGKKLDVHKTAHLWK